MQKIYQPQSLEAERLAEWAPTSYFSPQAFGEPYCMVLPPPNVTGSLHMGHGFQVSIMDALIRYQRMLGKQVLWQGGTDHAGIATQMVVERQLAAQGKQRHKMDREAFLTAINDWKNQSEARINKQLQRLGASIDFSRNRFTQDAGFNEAVIEVFIRLYKDGLLYRGKRLVNWDPQLLTAISDLEVVHTEESGSLYYLRYPLSQGNGHLVVATTRPETLFGDVAVAVHPEDSRYNSFIGQHLKLPLTERTIPIIADSEVDPAFGTGCVKITPAHDFNDYKIGQRHQLPIISILTPKATLNEAVPALYQGMDCIEARKAVISALKAADGIEKVEPHTLKVPRGDRSGAVIEPYLTDQWFMKMKPLAERAMKAIQTEQVRFVPENWKAICLQWLENIEDWCISRQLWWGHRIPVWYGPNAEIFVGISEADVRANYHLDASIPLQQEKDVLDTWVSSALWPFVTLDWPQETVELKSFYPTAVLVTGFDIIFFWVARMLMLGLYFMEDVPFKTVYVTGLIRDHQGQKMSKSKGNVLDPLDIIEGIDLSALLKKRTQGLMQPSMAQSIETMTRQQFPKGISAFGTDALRLTYYSLASPTRDIRFDMNRTLGYRNFCNKLWQATRFVCAQHEGSLSEECIFSVEQASIFDRWILSRLQTTIQAVHHHFEAYRFDLITQVLYEFVWHDYCDWYLEFTKPLLKTSNQLSAQTTKFTLAKVLETILRLLHPLIPFITETLWYEVAPLVNKSTDVHFSQVTYPQQEAHYCDLKSEQTVNILQSIIRTIRGLRSELKIAPHQTISLLWKSEQVEEIALVNHHQCMIEQLSKVAMKPITESILTAQEAAIGQVGSLHLLIPLEELGNKADEIRRLQKEYTQLERSLKATKEKLANNAFIQKAPKAIVEKTQKQLLDEKEKLEVIQKQLAILQ